MMRVVESRGAWDTSQRIGMIDILVVPDGATAPVNRVNFQALDGESFAAMMSLLNSHDKLLYNPSTKVLFSAR